jgi:hypothetical protein
MRLTTKERRESKRLLGAWYPPSEMRAKVQCLMGRLGSTDLFTQAGVDFITEAWVAADFGERRGAAAVRLITEAKRPDIALQFEHGEVEIYEIVEADRRGRERSNEYRALEAAGYPTYQWPAEEWATAEQAFEALRQSADIKANNAAELAAKGIPYPSETHLLFYLNLVDFGASTEEIENVIPIAVDPARKWFASVWVLWKLRAYQV